MHENKTSKIVLFVFLAFFLSYGLSFGFQWVVAVHQPSVEPTFTAFIAKSFAVSGPALAAVIVIWLSRGSVRRWFRKDLSQTHFSYWWLGIPAFTMVTTLLAFASMGASVANFPALIDDLPSLLGFFAFHLLVVGMLEELGWRGWLLRRLLRTQTPLLATLVIAPIWFAWHLPKLLSDPTFAFAFAIGELAAAIILTALWSRYRGRTALAVLAHGSFNAPIYFMADQFPEVNSVGAFTIAVSVYALVAIAMLITNWRWWLSKPPSPQKRLQQSPS